MKKCEQYNDIKDTKTVKCNYACTQQKVICNFDMLVVI